MNGNMHIFTETSVKTQAMETSAAVIEKKNSIKVTGFQIKMNSLPISEFIVVYVTVDIMRYQLPGVLVSTG